MLSFSLSLSLSAPILSISTCSNTRVAPHLEVTAEKIRGDNCILSLHIILEPQKVNFSWIFINHRRIQTTCYVPLWCLQLFFFTYYTFMMVTEGQKLEVYVPRIQLCGALQVQRTIKYMRHTHRDKELKSLSLFKNS